MLLLKESFIRIHEITGTLKAVCFSLDVTLIKTIKDYITPHEGDAYSEQSGWSTDWLRMKGQVR